MDDLARNVDRLLLDVDSLKLRSSSPNRDINESLKAMRISIDECKERTAVGVKTGGSRVGVPNCASRRMVSGGRGHDVYPGSGPLDGGKTLRPA